MKVTINDRVTMSDLNKLPLKGNLLRFSPIPEIIDADGNPFEAKSGKITEIIGQHTMCDRRHVQIHGKLPFTVTYKIESDDVIDKLLVSTFTASINYGYGRYEVYLSNDKETLYSEENYVAEYDRREVFNPKDLLKGTAQIFTLDKPQKANFFGIKFTHGCHLDTVVRLDFAGAFSNGSAKLLEALEKFGVDALSSASVSCQNNNITFDLGYTILLDTLVVSNENEVVEISENGTDFTALKTCYVAEDVNDFKAFVHKGEFKARYIRSTTQNIMGAFSTKTIFDVTNEVITEDFLGVGTNVIPSQLMEESTGKFGYDPEFAKLEYDAIRELDIKVIRVWFQNDWFQLAPDEYDFNMPKMQQFLEYMDVFRELGTEIELDFSWIVGKKLQSWYTIPEIPDQARSAPRDTKQFARSVVAALKFLCDEKGYNIKYIAVSNEPENGNFAVTPDNNIDEKKKYIVQTLKDIDSELKAANMRDRFEIWGAEDSAATRDRDWLAYLHTNAGDIIDVYTKHIYIANNDEIVNVDMPYHFEDTKNSKVGITEFGCHLPTFRKSTVGNFIAGANGGSMVMLHWCLTNSVIPDPFSSPFDEDICLYRNDEFKNNGLYIESICNEIGPAIKYVPAHSKVMKTICSNPLDARGAVFTKGDDVTIVIEANEFGNRELNINIGTLTNKPFKMLCYNISEAELPKKLLPELTPVKCENGVIKQALSPNHTMYLFTTL